ncbi:MAG TPA: histidine phosphatase family protein [Usitatibacter sp.]|nr:histidine phosphatase family protein [Usitatibacter sp.]
MTRAFFVALLALACAPAWAGDDDKLWAQLRRGGNVLLVRHASTESGLGDPARFRIDDCATQRNLSDAGRQEARRIGERLKNERVPIAQVYTSPWCRCRETAMLAFGRAEEWAPLSSVFDMPDRDREFSERVAKRIGTYSSRPMKGNVVMVTHNVNIASLTRLSIAPGEMVVVRPDGCCGLRVSGRLLLVGGT